MQYTIRLKLTTSRQLISLPLTHPIIIVPNNTYIHTARPNITSQPPFPPPPLPELSFYCRLPPEPSLLLALTSAIPTPLSASPSSYFSYVCTHPSSIIIHQYPSFPKQLNNDNLPPSISTSTITATAPINRTALRCAHHTTIRPIHESEHPFAT
jgi:hypothetical protein